MITNQVQFDALCSKVAKLTDQNDHTGANLEVAKFFNLKHFIRVFEYCDFQHDIDGLILDDVSSIRKRNGVRMMLYLQAELSESDYNKLSNSF